MSALVGETEKLQLQRRSEGGLHGAFWTCAPWIQSTSPQLITVASVVMWPTKSHKCKEVFFFNPCISELHPVNFELYINSSNNQKAEILKDTYKTHLEMARQKQVP